MSALWTDVATRARGLGTHLLGRSTLEGLAGLPDVAALAEALRALGRVPIGTTTAPEIELALRRGHAAWLEVLARWCGPRAERLSLVFEAEDLRSLRRLFRVAGGAGVTQESALASPLAGLVPTPSLPERALATLAEQPTPRALVTLLGLWKHPFAAALEGLALDKVDLFALDRALERAFAERATAAARGAERALVDATRRAIDVTNLRVLLVLAQLPPAAREGGAFLTGGQLVTRARFDRALSRATPDEAARDIAEALGRSPLAVPLRTLAAEPKVPSPSRLLMAVEAELWATLLRVQRQDALREPLGVAPVLAFALGVRLEALDLGAITWGIALGAPRTTVAAALVTP